MANFVYNLPGQTWLDQPMSDLLPAKFSPSRLKNCPLTPVQNISNDSAISAKTSTPFFTSIFITAIRLQNKGNSQITLDPRELQGQFYAATFQHNWLGGYVEGMKIPQPCIGDGRLC